MRRIGDDVYVSSLRRLKNKTSVGCENQTRIGRNRRIVSVGYPNHWSKQEDRKTDKASMLDEVIEYLKQLQAQVQMMNRMNIPPMMLPMAMQQQLQMSMMGMGMGVMDMNAMNRPNIAGISPVMPNPFMAITSWPDGSGDRLQQAASAAAVMPDHLSTFLACQSQPMTMDAYSRLAAMYQQMQQQLASGSKS